MLNGFRLLGLPVLGVLVVTAVVILASDTASAKTCKVTLSGGTLSSPVELPAAQVQEAVIESGQLFWLASAAALAQAPVYDRIFQLELICGAEGFAGDPAVYSYVARPSGELGLLFRNAGDGRTEVLLLSWPFERLIKAAILSGEPGADGRVDLSKARYFEGLMKVASARQAPFASMAGSSSPQNTGIQWTSRWPIAAGATAGLAVLAALAWAATRRRRHARLLLRDNAA